MITLNISQSWTVILTLSFLFLLYLVFIIILVLWINNKKIAKRIDKRNIIDELSYTSYKNLQKEDIKFNSQGKELKGEIYYYNKRDNQKIIIFSNGYNNTIANYLNYISYFASLGYTVYAYDYAGTGKSNGDKFEGMPQAIIDLHNYILKIKEMNPNCYITLVGHSMGAYASINVLNLVKVNKVIAISPFNNAQDIVNEHIYYKIGKKIFLFKMIYKFVSYLKFRQYATFSTFKTIKYAYTNILIIHGEDDKIVKVDNFINSMMSNHNAYIKYLLLENKQHDPLLSTNAINYNLYLKHQLTDLNLNYKKNIPNDEIIKFNNNINHKMKNELDENVILKIKQYLNEV